MNSTENWDSMTVSITSSCSMISLYKKISTRKDVKILETLIMAGHQFCLVVPSRINSWAMLFCCQNMGRCTTTNARYLLRMAGILK